MALESTRFPLAAITIAVALGACAQPAPRPESALSIASRAASEESVEGKRSITAEVFYRLLLAEVAMQRGEPALAARAFLDAARQTDDVALARRAAEVAMMTRQRDAAEQAATLWLKLEPDAERPRQMLSALAAGALTQGPEEAGSTELMSRLEKFLADAAKTGTGVGEPFLQLNRVFNQQSDKRAVFRIISDLAKPYPDSPEAQFAVALAGFNAASLDASVLPSSMQAVDKALALKPDWDRAVLLKAELLAKRSPGEAVSYLEQAILRAPDSRPLQGALAQFLTQQKRYAEARTLYRQLFASDPAQRELQFGIAVLSVQMKDWDAAESELLELKRAGFGDGGQVEFYLAQVAEERGQLDEAIKRYGEVPDGERGWLARLRTGLVMGKQGKRDEARRFLSDLPAVTIEQRIQVRQTEAQVFRDANDHATALSVIEQALKEHADSPDLLYDRAMVLEKLDRIDDATATLQRLVEMKPDDAQSLNALGYTLVDRTTRIDEGYQLIEKAHQLAPDDPFILDSMGWALFRMGRLEEAEKYLSRAFFERPDPEIAAHLGEVLFARGEPQKARQVWQTQLKLHPDHPLLLETVRRHSH